VQTKCLFALLLLMGLLFSSQAMSSQQNDVPQSLCSKNEQIIFACPVEKEQLISLCASQEFGADSGYLQFRLGTSKKIVRTLPEEQSPPSKAARSGTLIFSGGGGAYVQMADGDSLVYIYAAIGRWGSGKDAIAKEGLAIMRGDKMVTDMRCLAPATSELGPDFFERADLSEAETEFDLPE